MTTANIISIARICLIPVFMAFALISGIPNNDYIAIVPYSIGLISQMHYGGDIYVFQRRFFSA